MTAARSITHAEWFDLEEDDPRELVDGILVEAEMPNRIHEVIVATLLVWLGAFLRPRGGFAFASGLKLAVRARSGRMPDVVAYVPGRKPLENGVIHTPPDVVVEVISSRARDVHRDRVDKLADYAAFGVKQYWLVDPKRRTFEIWALDSKRHYVRIVLASRGKIRSIPNLRGLVIDVDALWSEVARLEKK